jgi:8-oxo-dGTP diphosphatase
MADKKRVGVGFGVMVLNSEGRILLGKRHDDPEKADSELHGEGTWTMPGGKIEFGETFEEAATREVEEETSIVIDGQDLSLISLENDAVADAQFVTIGFFCDKFTGEAKVMEPDEITEWKWFELDSLPSPIFFPSQKVINHYDSGIVYK